MYLNFKALVENDNLNWKVHTNKAKYYGHWSQIKEISTSYRKPFQFEIKYDLNCIDTLILSIIKTKNKEKYNV